MWVRIAYHVLMILWFLATGLLGWRGYQVTETVRDEAARLGGLRLRIQSLLERRSGDVGDVGDECQCDRCPCDRPRGLRPRIIGEAPPEEAGPQSF